MGLRLSKDLKRQQTPSNGGFDISGLYAKDYDLEELEALKSRISKDKPLNVQVSDERPAPKPGSIGLAETAESLKMGPMEYSKYLLDDEQTSNKSTVSSNGTISLKRPIVIVEEGTIDNSTSKAGKTIYDEVNDLKAIIENLTNELNFYKANTAQRIDLDSGDNLITNRGSIPTVGAVYDYMETYRGTITRHDFMDNEILGLNNGRLSFANGEYILSLNDASYDMREQLGDEGINHYTLRIGG